MKFKKLGHTNIDVSLICLGTMNMGEQNTQEESFEQMDYSFEQGINFLTQRRFMLFHQEKKHKVKRKRLLEIGLSKVKKEKKLF